MVMKLDDLVNAMRYAFFRSGRLYVDISSEAYKFYVEILLFHYIPYCIVHSEDSLNIQLEQDSIHIWIKAPLHHIQYIFHSVHLRKRPTLVHCYM